jgi:hypothetical protein
MQWPQFVNFGSDFFRSFFFSFSFLYTARGGHAFSSNPKDLGQKHGLGRNFPRSSGSPLDLESPGHRVECLRVKMLRILPERTNSSPKRAKNLLKLSFERCSRLFESARSTTPFVGNGAKGPVAAKRCGEAICFSQSQQEIENVYPKVRAI